MNTLFLMTPDAAARKLNLEFLGPVRVHGLQPGEGASAEVSDDGLGSCFETELPPLSVIPLSLYVEKTAVEVEKGVNGSSAELA
jgi:hypothetical protein